MAILWHDLPDDERSSVTVHDQDPYSQGPQDSDPEETGEWQESLRQLVQAKGPGRAREIMLSLLKGSKELHLNVPMVPTTDYINTIAQKNEPEFPGDEELERRYRKWIRWNAAVTVHRAQRPGIGVGGHISTYASSAALYEVGFNHFFRGLDDPSGGDQIFIQGHASPGAYARAFLEGRLTEAQLDGFRQEKSAAPNGIPSYPHPRLMPEFWQFPTVSMGLGPINAIYQAMSNKYLSNRGIKDVADSHVWAYLGDGEMDEVESRGQLQVAANEGLDNLTFIVNCNLQRLDGPVRGNGKIIQELESFFRGAGWNVIKVVWGREWDDLLARDTEGALLNLMNSTPDGDYQTYKAENGAYVREHFFGRDPRALELVKDYTDEQVWGLKRGGHDYRKVFAAFKAAKEHMGQPTVILAKTIKGYGLGPHFEGRNATHQMKKLTLGRPQGLPRRDGHPGDRRAAGGEPLPAAVLQPRREGRDDRVHARASPFARRVPARAPHNPRRSRAARRPGVRAAQEGVGHAGDRHDYGVRPPAQGSAAGQGLRPPHRADHPRRGAHVRYGRVLPHGEDLQPQGSALHLRRPRAAAGVQGESAGPDHPRRHQRGGCPRGVHRGRHRVRHARPAADPGLRVLLDVRLPAHGRRPVGGGDQMARGFIIGATAGRTTLTGEGLQHADGHSQLLASTNPATVSYDPAYGYEIAHIVRSGIERMYGGEHSDPNVMYYITVYNEPYVQPAEPEGVDVDGIVRGIHHISAGEGEGPRTQLLASGVGVPWAFEAQRLLKDDWGVVADVWSVTSWTELRRDGLAADEHNYLHPDAEPRTAYLTDKLKDAEGPVVAVSDWMHAVQDQIRQWVPQNYWTLGADGFGFSDTRAAARRYFKIDGPSLAVRALQALAAEGKVDRSVIAQAIEKYRPARRERRHERERRRRGLIA
ncbi:hypothetical protein LUZ63_023113 [Rhynchospora breviuscula]|uniref:Pyruvate dehydrogenase E1 component n=1 Tax=Rhynchospora breviuscula TaxID=2022672 RepID=A0A9P9Z3H6_9POAL|nr:hypothetical protein LUZ63_023113 [Rhynchospora breviuscula]